ncbi:hypothetical protein FGB62_336g025 [Gracilaria domingensis]|nr:hypothetical protein FGB62_336g025 [Gracilaria domingensis]
MLQIRNENAQNWVFRVGKMSYKKDLSGRAAGSKLPDFMGCSDFGNEGVRDPKKSSLVKLPPHLQGANPHLVGSLVALAQHGIFPESRAGSGNCPPYPLSSRGKFCTRPAHLQESPTLLHIKCDVEYHYFLMKNDETQGHLSWAVVVGFGRHRHTWPMRKPSPKLVHNFVSNLCQEGKILTGPMILRKLEEEFGCAPSPATVKSIRRDFRKEQYPAGKSLTAFLEAFHSQKQLAGSGHSYVLSIEDHRAGDEFKLIREQKGLSVIFEDPRLLSKASSSPRFGCDGTFGIVNGHGANGELLSFELVSIVAKDEETGCAYSVMHQLCTRKTSSFCSMLFQEFLKQLRYRGVHDPLRATGNNRLTMATDFETTYAFSLATILSEQFRPGSAIDYLKAIAVGCDVHAKRCIMEKCSVGNERTLFQRVLGTWDLNCREECDKALNIMKCMGGKWESFAIWLSSNQCVFILSFQKLNCSIPIAERHRALFFYTNANESYHNMVKSLPNFALQRGHGLEFMDEMKLLRELDHRDAANLCKKTPFEGYQKISKPEWRRTQSKARKRHASEVIVIDDTVLPAQQPKRAKRSTPITKKPRRTKEEMNSIQELISKIEKLEAMLAKVLEQNKKD